MKWTGRRYQDKEHFHSEDNHQEEYNSKLQACKMFYFDSQCDIYVTRSWWDRSVKAMK